MKVAIIHSATKPDQAIDLAGFDVVIVVDQAAAHFKADWWVVSLDHIDVKPKGDPGIFANSEIADHFSIGKSEEWVKNKVKRYEPHWKDHPSKLGWSLYPSAAAVVLAKALGATEVALIGESAVDGRAGDCIKCEKAVVRGVLEHHGLGTANQKPPVIASPAAGGEVIESDASVSITQPADAHP